MSAAGFQPPARSAAVNLFSAVISAFRWAILGLILVLLAPYALAQFDNSGALRRHEPGHRRTRLRGGTLFEPVRALHSDLDCRPRPHRLDHDRWPRHLRHCRRLASTQDPTSVSAAANAQAGRGLAKADAHPGEFVCRARARNQAARARNRRQHEPRRPTEGLRRRAREKLDQYGREVAFLSIDVVGSTAMKRGRRPGRRAV